MAFQIIWVNYSFIYFIIMDYISKTNLEVIDCRNLEGQQRYIELFGLKKFKMYKKKYGVGIDFMKVNKDITLSKELSKTLFSNLNERSRRLVAGFLGLSLNARKRVALAQFLSIDYQTMKRGIMELLTKYKLPKKRVRREGGGRKALDVKYPEFYREMDEILDDHTAGDPMNLKRWVRKSLSYYQTQFRLRGISISITSLKKYFRKENISLKGFNKNYSTQNHKDRDSQFKQIDRYKKSFNKANLPVIYIDSKKRELIGLLARPGKIFRKVAKLVFDHDFPSLAEAKILPFGIYDEKYNTGHVYCNATHETPQFLVEMIVLWWREVGRHRYPNSKNILILCDAGGSNGYRRYGWKWELQTQLANAFGLKVTVCHYPPGASKWNKIEHRLFSFISINWAGEVLDSIQKMLGFIKSTTTKTGLRVEAHFIYKPYQTGFKYKNLVKRDLNIKPMKVLPRWNYTIHPEKTKTKKQ